MLLVWPEVTGAFAEPRDAEACLEVDLTDDGVARLEARYTPRSVTSRSPRIGRCLARPHRYHSGILVIIGDSSRTDDPPNYFGWSGWHPIKIPRMESQAVIVSLQVACPLPTCLQLRPDIGGRKQTPSDGVDASAGAHNPKVVGSNPTPATIETLVGASRA